MTANVLVFDPTAPQRATGQQKRQALETLTGKVVGFIDNSKPNFNYLVDDVAEILASEYGVKSIIKRKKDTAAIPAPREIISELANQCDLVITGSGD